MSDNACSTYGINKRLFQRVCPGKHCANAAGFARIYISGLHGLVSKQDARLDMYTEKVKMLKEQLKMKDEMIALLKQRPTPSPSAPPKEEGETI